MPFNTNLNFEDKETKKLLSKLDFEYFLKQNIEEEKYGKEYIDEMYTSFNDNYKILKQKTKVNRKQFYLYHEGNVRKMFTGGFLTAIFLLDEGRTHRLLDFKEVGLNWAIFNLWSKNYRRKITFEKVWDIIIKTGSLLAIVLSIVKITELFI